MLIDESYLRHVGYFVVEQWNEDLQQHERLPWGTIFSSKNPFLSGLM